MTVSNSLSPSKRPAEVSQHVGHVGHIVRVDRVGHIDHVHGDRVSACLGLAGHAEAKTSSRQPPDHLRLDPGVTGDTFAAVQTISIKQLHARTGHWVRAARTTPVIVTDHGEEVAVLNSREKSDLPRPVFTLAGRKPRPKVSGDSTVLISADRDAR